MTETNAENLSFLHRTLPEQRIYIKTGEDHTRYFTLSPVVQALLAIGLFGVASWMIVATTALIIGYVSADNNELQSQVMQDAYEARIALLSEERDQRALESSAIQQRFRSALTEMTANQSDLLTIQHERRELQTAISLMRDKLATALDERDLAMDEADRLSEELSSVVENLSSHVGTESDLEDTLTTISTALADVVRERDLKTGRLIELQDRLAEMEFKAQVNADRQERIFSQLEDAVLITLDPLEKLLQTSGKDVDYLLEQVRSQYSGSGGPFIPAALPLTSDDDPIYKRFRTLMTNLDRAHLMKLAAEKIPFASPVRQSVRYTSGFGRRKDPITGRGRMHSGQDLAGARNTPILAAADGTVSFAGRQSGYGKVVKIRHSFGYETVYAHLNSFNVKSGDSISRGDVLGGMGNTGRSTGTHLHYEIRIGGTPVNPMPYMKAAKDVF